MKCPGTGERKTFAPSQGRLPFRADGEYSRARVRCSECGASLEGRVVKEHDQYLVKVPSH